MKKFCVCLMTVVLMVCISSNSSATNLLLNPSFETAGSGGAADAADWREDTAYTTRSNGAARTGSWSIAMSEPMGSMTYPGQLVQLPDISAYANGTEFTLSIWGMNPSSDPLQEGERLWLTTATGKWDPGLIWVQWSNAFGVDWTSPLDTWIKTEVVLTKSADATFINFNPLLQRWWQVGAGGTLYLDDAVIIPEPATMILLSLGGLSLLRKRS